MPSHIPSTRLGRALKAGIPVALIMLGAELLDGSIMVDRDERGLTLSWSSTPEEGKSAREPFASLTACFSGACERWSVSTALPRPHFAADIMGLAQTIVRVVSGDCVEEQTGGARLVTG